MQCRSRASCSRAHNPLPKGARDVLPNFNGDKKILVEEHLNSFNLATGILAVQHEDVAVRIFAQTLTEGATDWFGHVQAESITDWKTMKTTFEKWFESVDDENSLLA